MVHTIQIRLTRRQYEQIRDNAKTKGFASMSAYLRYLGLDQDFVVERKVHEIHAHLIPKKPDRGKHDAPALYRK